MVSEPTHIANSETLVEDKTKLDELARDPLFPPDSLAALVATRRMSRMIEVDSMRDDIHDELEKERVRRKQPTGARENIDRLLPEEGEHDSRLLNFFTNSDPLKGVSTAITEKLEFNALKGKNALHHTGTSLKVYAMHRVQGATKEEARMLTQVMSNELRHGNQALDRARKKTFLDRANDDQQMSW